MEKIIEYKFYKDEVFSIIPQEEPFEFIFGSRLNVEEDQEAYFLKENEILGPFGKGFHILKESFYGHILFIKKKKVKKKWGTLEPVPYKDKDTSLIYIKSYGTLKFFIENRGLFIEKLIKNKKFYLTEELDTFLRNLIFYYFSKILKEKEELKNIGDGFLEIFRDLLFENLKDELNKIGINLKEIKIIGINLPKAKIIREEKKNLCKNCRKEIKIEANFCPFCGERISKSCSQCLKEVPDFAIFCPYCGKKIH